VIVKKDIMILQIVKNFVKNAIIGAKNAIKEPKMTVQSVMELLPIEIKMILNNVFANKVSLILMML